MSYASQRRAFIQSVRREVRTKVTTGIINKPLNDAHIEALLLFHAGFKANSFILEELYLKGLLRNE